MVNQYISRTVRGRLFIVKTLIFLLIFTLFIPILSGCGNENGSEKTTFRGVNWGATVDDVIKAEEELGNTVYEKEETNSNIFLTYSDIKLDDGNKVDLTYTFEKSDYFDETDEYLLVEAKYHFGDTSNISTDTLNERLAYLTDEYGTFVKDDSLSPSLLTYNHTSKEDKTQIMLAVGGDVVEFYAYLDYFNGTSK